MRKWDGINYKLEQEMKSQELLGVPIYQRLTQVLLGVRGQIVQELSKIKYDSM